MNLTSSDVAWFRALHYGGPHVCLWIAILPDTSLHVRLECWLERSVISKFADAMRSEGRRLGIEKVKYTVADRLQLRGKAIDDTGETRADTFRRNQIVIRETTHDPIQGWTRIQELLGRRPSGQPWLTIHPSCVHLISALTQAVSDPTNPEDVQSFANDQALRALRVGVMSRPAPNPKTKPPLPKEAVGRLLDAVRRGERTSGQLIQWR